MTYYIKKPDSDLFIHTEIDPGGMSINWTQLRYADVFATLEYAEAFVARCEERFPSEKFKIIDGHSL